MPGPPTASWRVGEESEVATRENDADDVRRPRHVRMPGFVRDEEVGLGDAIKRATYVLGIKPCTGCERRAEALNRLLVFTGRGRSTKGDS
jgi:hypothetical protein